MNFKKAFKASSDLFKQVRPIIFGIAGMASFTSAVVLAVKATPKALELKAMAEFEKGSELTKVETIKTCWKPYTATAIATIGGIGFTTLGFIDGKNAIAGVLLMKQECEKYAESLKQAIDEEVGDKKAAAIKERAVAIESEKDENGYRNCEFIVGNNTGYLVHDIWSGSWFRSTQEDIRSAIPLLNEQIAVNKKVTVSDWADILEEACHLKSSLPVNEAIADFYWDSEILEDEGFTDIAGNARFRMEDVEFSTGLSPSGEPCLTVRIPVNPWCPYVKY